MSHDLRSPSFWRSYLPELRRLNTFARGDPMHDQTMGLEEFGQRVFNAQDPQQRRPLLSRDRLGRLRREIALDLNAIDTVLSMLPAEMTYEQDHAFQRLFLPKEE